MAIACFLLLTVRPERPLRNDPSLRLCIARFTLLAAFLPYRAMCGASYLMANWTAGIAPIQLHDRAGREQNSRLRGRFYSTGSFGFADITHPHADVGPTSSPVQLQS